MTQKLPANAIWKNFPGNGEPAHFYNANGFPFGVYNRLLTRLSKKFKLNALEWQKNSPNTVFKEDFSYGHLMPLENPARCFDLIEQGLSEAF